MMEPTQGSGKPRGALVVAVAGIAWQALIIEFALRHGPTVQGMLTGLGGTSPTITAAFLASYRWWPLLPIACAVLLIWAHQRARTSTAMTVAASCALGVGLLLQTWTNEAMLAPLLEMISKV